MCACEDSLQPDAPRARPTLGICCAVSAGVCPAAARSSSSCLMACWIGAGRYRQTGRQAAGAEKDRAATRHRHDYEQGDNTHSSSHHNTHLCTLRWSMLAARLMVQQQLLPCQPPQLPACLPAQIKNPSASLSRATVCLHMCLLALSDADST